MRFLRLGVRRTILEISEKFPFPDYRNFAYRLITTHPKIVHIKTYMSEHCQLEISIPRKKSFIFFLACHITFWSDCYHKTQTKGGEETFKTSRVISVKEHRKVKNPSQSWIPARGLEMFGDCVVY
jgi:hypothetical protein